MDGLFVNIGQESVHLGWNAGTNTLTGTGPRGALFTVELTNPATGAYKVTLLDNVLHARSTGWAMLAAGSVQEAHDRSEEHTSQLQSLMRISYAVFCLKKKKTYRLKNNTERHNTAHTHKQKKIS